MAAGIVIARSEATKQSQWAREDQAMFDLDRFIEDCRDAVRQDSSHKAAREVLARAVSDPNSVLAALGEPTRAGIDGLYRSDDLTILNVVWGPRMTIMPHNHLMWAVIGIYTGREDNIFWRRLPEPDERRIEAVGARSLGNGDVEPLGRDIIHSVTNPLSRLTGAIHVYGGDFFSVPRSEWDPESLAEQPFDLQRAMQLYEKANAALPRG
jgi:predicted metal-dependent enzyme (double-stranded beta helix superfamily)